MLQITGQIARRLASARPSAALAAACSTQAAENKHFDVPAGHEHSDLRPAKAHIGLNRRRDLSLRADISVYRGAECVTLRDWLRGGTSVIFGLPDMGKACSEIHAPGFVNLVDDFKAVGVDQIWAVAIGDPEKVDGWARKTKLSEGRIRAVADRTGAFARLLGLEMNKADQEGPHCQRYVGLVEDGVLLKLKVDEEPTVVKDSSAECMLGILKSAKEKAEKERQSKAAAAKETAEAQLDNKPDQPQGAGS